MDYPGFINNILINLCNENISAQKNGFGPFAAAICDNNGNIIATAHNSVVIDNCSIHHAEINVINIVQKKFNNYNLSEYNLSICITAEPCSMCVGAIMWSGIKNIYYGLPSTEVEHITGFDEGHKPDWEKYLRNKGINVVGNIEPELCRKVLQNYINLGKIIYKP